MQRTAVNLALRGETGGGGGRIGWGRGRGDFPPKPTGARTGVKLQRNFTYKLHAKF